MYQLLTFEENPLLKLDFVMTEEELKSAQASEAATSNRLYFPWLNAVARCERPWVGIGLHVTRAPCVFRMSPLQ